jgi:hypothetical protein
MPIDGQIKKLHDPIKSGKALRGLGIGLLVLISVLARRIKKRF